MTNPEKYETQLTTHLIVAGFAGLALVFYRYKNTILKKFLAFPSFKDAKIHIVNDHKSCEEAVKKINTLFTEQRILGFDCEWVTKNGSRHPVALIQLASSNGECTLIRLSKIQYVPRELKILLEDPSIFKIGVAPSDDAKYLWNDYAVRVNGVLDLRHLAVLNQEKPEGLASLAEKHLNLKMDKHWQIRCSDWEADTLSQRQIKYAADDANVSIGLFEYFITKLLKQNTDYYLYKLFRKPNWEEIENICKKFINVKFSDKQSRVSNVDFKNLISKEQRDLLNTKSQRRSYTSCIKSKIVYENCYMKTADGETLCTCDRKKAEWYVEKELAEVICDEPFTIKLKFEPAGRSVGTVGLFYQMPRKKICVVCGPTESYIKKNVIPREYRRLFPLVMKDHSSHDVLLLCMNCHQLSNIRDQSMRTHLAQICNAPITNTGQPKIIEDPRIRKVKSAARALLVASSKHSIPNERKLELEREILQFFPSAKVITNELLVTACDLDYRSENSLYESHGQIVVDYFVNRSGGLLELEKIWREHFLTSMEPKYMPEFWSVTHTKSRLEIRVNEGRVNKEDLEKAGLTTNNPCI